MTRGASITVENNFTRGLITEFTAMNFPENAVTDADNVIFSELGKTTRRLGADFENGSVKTTLSSISSRPNAYSEFKWYSTGPDGTVQLMVQQVGDKLTFWSISTSAALSTGKKSFTVDLSTFAAPGVSADAISIRQCQFTTGRSKLVVSHPLCDPFYVSYDSGTDSIESTKITIKIRDFKRLDDSLEIDQRPTTLTNLHKYNLYNQGWYTTAPTYSGNLNVLTYWDSQRSDFPSNADVWWTLRDDTGDDAYYFAPAKANQGSLGNTPAPNGHYIYEAFDLDRTEKTGITGLPSEQSLQARPLAVAFYAGRVFYAGIAQDGFSDKVYFSQIIDDDSKFGHCYQQQDPTAEEVGDLLDTDGGVISLPLIETVTSMKVVGDALFVLATNGIYVISGTLQSPFKATDYSVSYLSTIGATGASSVVVVDGGLIWWNTDGIYALRQGQGGYEVVNISKPTIQTFISEVPNENIPYIKGAYNRRDQLVRWLFSDADGTTGFAYNRILEFNLASQAFYPFTIDTSLGPVISGIVSIGGQRGVETLENVTNNALTIVTNNAAANVQVEVTEFVPDSELFKFTIIGPIGTASAQAITFGELNDPNLRDWRSFDSVGIAYNSYGISGYRIRGDFLRKFQSTPIEFVVKNIDDGRCLVSGIWDYGFRYTFEYELYLTRPEVDYLLRRIKLRGKGRSLQIKFRSVEDNPFELTGWSTFDTGGTLP